MSRDKEHRINVTSYNQSGGITAHTVNLQSQVRHIDDNIRQLRSALPMSKRIDLCSVMGDGEALQFASEIKAYLAEQGYNVDGVSQVIYSQPVMGQEIHPGENEYKVIIGTHQ